MARAFLTVCLIMMAMLTMTAASAGESRVYPRPQDIKLDEQHTTINKVVVRQRGKKSGGVWDKLPAVSGGYAIRITPGRLVVYANDDAGEFYAKQTLIQLLPERALAREAHRDPYPGESIKAIFEKKQLPTGEITDWPDLPYRGVVEGYYGIPWTVKGRMAQFEFYGRNKMNTFIYAPKDDPYHHGQGCYQPYPPEKAKEIKEMVAHARRNHVKFFWAIHPANTVNWGEQNGQPQLNQLCAKLQQLYDLGVRDFGVFVDDSSGEIGRASRQIQLCNYIQEHFIRKHPEANQELLMCPTGYNRSWTNEGFLTEMGKGLPKDIFMMWTGNTVVHDIRLNDQKWVNQFLKSPTFIWWNWPCNDFRRDRLSMGRTYGLGTEEEMKEQMSGFVANPMEHAEANKVGLFGVADYCWNISGFDSVSTWKEGIARLYPAHRKEMQLFCNHNSNLLPNGHGYYREESAELAPTARTLREQLTRNKPGEQELKKIRKVFRDIRKAGKKLRQGKGNMAELKDAIHPWFRQFELLGEAGDRILDSCQPGKKKPLLNFLKATEVLARMKETTRPQWNNGNIKQVQGVTVGTEHLMPVIEAALRYINEEIYRDIAGSKADKAASVIPTVTSSIQGIGLTLNDTDAEISINRVMEYYPLPAGGSIELNIPTGTPAREVVLDFENNETASWAKVEFLALNGRKSKPEPERRGSALHFPARSIPKSGLRKVVVTNSSQTEQRIKINQFKIVRPPREEWVDTRWLSDADISTSVDCSARNLRFSLAVPRTGCRRIILIGTAEAEISPGKTTKRSGPVLYHTLPKGARSITISTKKEKGARLNEIIFR